MLKLSACCLAALVALHAPAFAQESANPSLSASEQALAARLDAAIAPWYKADAPGAAVIVTQNGKTLLRKGYGLADVAKGTPMTPDMRLRLGSITKQFTAVGILMLLDEGKLALDDDITRFLPDYPTRGKRITIAHLLSHTSGIVNYTSKLGFSLNAARDKTVPQLIDGFKDDALDFEPGTRWVYNNSGYVLLGAVIEKLSGQSYASFLAERIFKPLDMRHTAYEGHERHPGPRALGHTKGWFGVTTARPLSMTQPYAAGALVSTVDDMARWDAAISAGKLLKPATWQQAHSGVVLAGGKPTNYGYGWQVGKLRGVPMVSHGGMVHGFTAYAVRLPRQKVYVAVLANTDDVKVQPELVASRVAAIAIGDPFPDVTPVKVDNVVLDAYAGAYRIDPTATRSFRRDDGKLVMQRTGRDPVTLTAIANDGFVIPDSLTSFVFARNAKGEVSHVVVHSQGAETVNQRIGAP